MTQQTGTGQPAYGALVDAVRQTNYHGSGNDRALGTAIESYQESARFLVRTAEEFEQEQQRLLGDVRDAARKVLIEDWRRILREHNVDELGEYPFDLQPSAVRTLHASGLNTLADLLPFNSRWAYTRLNGVGEAKSTKIYDTAKARSLELRRQTRISFSGELNTQKVALLGTLRQLQLLLVAKRSLVKFENARRVADQVAHAGNPSTRIQNRIPWLLPNLSGKVDARHRSVDLLTTGDEAVGTAQRSYQSYFDTAEQYRNATAAQILADFRQDPSAYYALLSGLLPAQFQGDEVEQRVEAAGSDLDQRLWEAINAVELDLDGFTAILRPYQEFGVKFMVHQRYTLLGDDMGLGKSVQALAYITHITNRQVAERGERPTHLVVAPLSVQANWVKEVNRFSNMRVHALQTRTDEIPPGIDIILGTYERVSDLLKDQVTGVVVVDEAHFAKNAKTGRTQRVLALIEEKRDVVFMSGTALENNLEELTRLIGFVSPTGKQRLQDLNGDINPEAYRKAISEVYLRRSKADVLKELPELLPKEEWVTMTAEEEAAYEALLADDAHWHTLRQVPYQSVTYAKMNRIVEIIEDAQAKGEKVLIFSFYLHTLDVIGERFAEIPQIRIDGDTKPDTRQPLIDGFNEAEGTMLYLSQIGTGGMGLNLQSASRVIICEPQVKPSLETQAAARAHRMGQLNTVTMHYLITQNALDEMVYTYNKAKQALFDEYADRSDMGDKSLSLEIPQGERRRMVAAEKRRRGL